MRKRTTYREKKYICGEYADVYIYPVYPVRQQHEYRKRIKKKPTREVQKKLNRRHTIERLTRILNKNFTEDDLANTLTYTENPESKEQAMRDIRNYLRRVKNRYKKAGLEFKYVWQLEISKKGRYHFHCVFSGGIDRDELEKLWGKGYANTKRLQFDKNGLAALARYICKQKDPAREPEEIDEIMYRSYNGSKNLIDPEPSINDSKIGSRKKAAQLAEMDFNLWQELYPEYEVADMNQFHSDEYGNIYIFARLHRVTEKTDKGKRGRCQ